MNFFKKKKEQPILPIQPEKPLNEVILTACESNTQAILSKLAHKRDEMLHLIAAEGKEEEIEERFEIMADYISRVPWSTIIDRTLKAARYTDVDNAWTDRVDVENAKLLVNMQWKIVRVDLNEMISKVMSLVEGEGA